MRWVSLLLWILFLSPHVEAQTSSGWGASLLENKSDAFESQLRCQYQCRSDRGPRVQDLEHTFDPTPAGYRLGRGNGNLYRKLSTYLWQWGEQACLLRAQTECGALEQVLSFELKQMSSGSEESQWLLDSPPSCDEETRKIQLSPYDPSRKLEAAKSKADPKLHPQHVALGSVMDDKDDNDSCEGPIIAAQLCYGDCLVLGGDGENCPDGAQTLCTAKSGVSQGVRVCAASILSRFPDNFSHSREVAEFECRKAFMGTLDEKDSPFRMIMGCAAVRAKIDCRDFVEQVRNKFPKSNMQESVMASPSGSKDNSSSHPTGESECCKNP